VTARRAALLAAVFLLVAAAPDGPARRQRLTNAGVTFARPVFETADTVRAATRLDPNHKDLLLLLFRNLPEAKASPDPFGGGRTCAVVGNSGNLKDAGYGREIDGHDVVIRMNDAPVKGYEKDVGTKTTIVIGAPAKTPVVQGPTIHYITYCDRIPETLKTINNVLTDHFLDHYRSFHVLDHRFFASLTRYTDGRPSTGLLSVFLALNACDKVDVYGFGKDPSGEWDHYYTQAKWNPGVHDVSGEEKTLNELAAKKLLTIHTGRR